MRIVAGPRGKPVKRKMNPASFEKRQALAGARMDSRAAVTSDLS